MKLEFETGGRRQKANATWYRGEQVNYNPTRANMRARGAVADYVLAGWLPERPFITPEMKVTAFGSCFARHVSEYLNRRNYSILTRTDANAYVVKMGEGIVNTYAMRGQFDWAFHGITPTQELWHGYQAEAFGYDEDVRATTRALFDQTDVFILTLGLSEVWYDEPTGEVFWRAVPADVFDPARHKFRVTTVQENVDNLRAIYRTIRAERPDAKIVVTLSPIPLVATFRPVTSLTANAVSKAILRAAIDEVYREVGDEGVLHYWPSYEIVMEGFGPGRWESDRRHVKRPVLDYIMGLFESTYCLGTEPEESLTALQVHAMRSAGDLPADALAAAEADDPDVLAAWIRDRLADDDRETADLLLAYAAERAPREELDALRREVAERAPEPARPGRLRRLLTRS